VLTVVQVDRVYVGSPGVIAVLDHEKKRTFIVRKEGLPDIGKTVCFYFRAKETRDQFGNQVLAL
jgi:hypothetical protein